MSAYEPCPAVHSCAISSVGVQLMMKLNSGFVGSLFPAMVDIANLNVSSSSSLK